VNEQPPSYEAARAELREIVTKLETGGQSLEESLALWERGEQLAEVCQRWLDDADERLDAAIAARESADAGSEDQSAETQTSDRKPTGR
jgi:exodeoxyribonuclease VII small subunit